MDGWRQVWNVQTQMRRRTENRLQEKTQGETAKFNGHLKVQQKPNAVETIKIYAYIKQYK